MTEYVMRVTIIVPSAMVDDANSLAAVLGASAADLLTFSTPAWRDVSGNLYSAASTLAKADFAADAAAPP